MRLSIALTLAVLLSMMSTPARGQEQPKYDVLKKMYDDALGSLKDAQNKKSELATRNEALAKQVADLQKQLDAANKERDELQRQAAGYAEKTYGLRSYYATWQEFLKRYPTLAAKWKVFLDVELLRAGNDVPALPEPEWPFHVEG